MKRPWSKVLTQNGGFVSMAKRFLSLLILALSLVSSAWAETICLNMIVKNEKDVICRCLASVKPLIDTWVIVDTGSTDGTQQVIRDFMQDVPGELHERPWKNFAHNRNEALDLARNKADYILIIDADDDLVYSPTFKLPKLALDTYHIKISHGGMVYSRPQLIKASLPWKWVGVLHEYLDCPNQQNVALLEGVTMRYGGDGARSRDPAKFRKDAEVLEAALKEEPYNSRYMFYLAQSYRDGGVYDKALEWYQKRVLMGGWDQEVFYSMMQVARLQQALKMDAGTWVDSYYQAYLYRPSRIEPLYDLVRHHRLKGDYFAGYLLAKQGLTTSVPSDVLFVEKWIYDWGLLLEYSICAAWIGQYQEAQAASHLIIANRSIPDNVRECVQGNMQWVSSKVAQEVQNTPVAVQMRRSMPELVQQGAAEKVVR
jgi:glycosyltransferase involved in cell wall biosynthesis